MSEQHPFRVYAHPEFESSTLVISWNEDVGQLGTRVTDYMIRELGCLELAEIEPADFFVLNGVTVENDIAQFPESKFYYSIDRRLVLFRSNSPACDWYRFLDSILEFAQQHCNTREVYTIGGMLYMGAHTTPRELISVANSPEMKERLNPYDLINNLEYETPLGQRPTLSTYLIWAAKKRNIPAASIWAPIPFYLIEAKDPRAWIKITEFLDQRLGLEINLSDFAKEVARLDNQLAVLRARRPEIDEYIIRMENWTPLSQQESEQLTREVFQHLNDHD